MYLAPRDYALYADEVRRYAPGIDVRRGTDEMIGGVRVDNARTGIYVNNTLKVKAGLCVDDLFALSGLQIDG